MLSLIYALTLLVGGLDHGGGLPKEVVGSLAGWCSLVGQCLENFHHHYCNQHHRHDHHDHRNTIIITWSKSMESNIGEQWRSSARPPVKYQILKHFNMGVSRYFDIQRRRS